MHSRLVPKLAVCICALCWPCWFISVLHPYCVKMNTGAESLLKKEALSLLLWFEQPTTKQIIHHTALGFVCSLYDTIAKLHVYLSWRSPLISVVLWCHVHMVYCRKPTLKCLQARLTIFVSYNKCWGIKSVTIIAILFNNLLRR